MTPSSFVVLPTFCFNVPIHILFSFILVGRTPMGFSRHRRSNSNHRCCYDFRFRDVATHEISDSPKSFSSTSSTTSNHRPKLSSTGSKNYSSSYGCSQSEKPYFENVRKRYFYVSMYFHNTSRFCDSTFFPQRVCSQPGTHSHFKFHSSTIQGFD